MVFLSMLSALAFVSVMFIKIPIMPSAPFLKFDLKDCIIIIGGLIYGPFSAFAVSLVVGLLQLMLIGENGIIGFLMNLLSSTAFVCTASAIYKIRRTKAGLITGLLLGVALMVISMLVWNYIITPLYMGIPREAIVPMLWTIFLPFNLLKGGINMIITLLYQRPLFAALSAVNFHDEEK